MVRAARWVVPGHTHHVTQRSNRRQRTFFSDDDRRLYRNLLAAQCRKAGVEIWANCLMPNHVHLIAVPAHAGALSDAIGVTHRTYSAIVHRH